MTDSPVKKAPAKKVTSKTAKKKTKKKKATKKKTSSKKAGKSKALKAEIVPIEDLPYEERLQVHGINDIQSGKASYKMSDSELVEWYASLKEKEAEREPSEKELKKYSPAADRLILQMKSQGKTDIECALAMGVNRKTIQRWREQSVSFLCSYARGRYLYLRGLGLRMIEAMGEGKSMAEFAHSEGIHRNQVFALAKSHKEFAELKALAIQASRQWWEGLAREAGKGDLTGFYDADPMQFQGKPITDPKTGKVLHKKRAHNKNYSDRLIMFQMQVNFADYNPSQQDQDNDLDKEWRDVIERFEQKQLAGSSKV
jgi:DNA-binding CsgD family transcriptional regulator